MMRRRVDVAVVGGGIVGLACARALLLRSPSLRVAVVDKEQAVATHQSMRNSGVIHSGIYYAPGSLRARLCVDGARRMYAYCQEHGVPVEQCGKLITATHEDELPRLRVLYERGITNGVAGLTLLDAAAIRRLEPHASGIAAIHCASCVCVCFGRVSSTPSAEHWHH